MPVIADMNVRVFPNVNAAKTSGQQFSDWTSSTTGAYRFAKAIQQPIQLAAEVADQLKLAGKETIKGMGAIASEFGKAANYLSFARFASTARVAYVAAEEAIEDTTTNKVLKAIKESSDWLASGFYSASLLGSKVALQAGDTLSLVADGVDLKDAATGVHSARRLQSEQISDEMKVALEQTEKHQLFKLIKAVASVASGILGLLGLLLGGPMIPSVALLIISLTSTTFAILSHFYKENMPLHLELAERPA
jgi:hypothetical protein